VAKSFCLLRVEEMVRHTKKQVACIGRLQVVEIMDIGTALVLTARK
jgi:hypothetical protein